MHWDVKQGPLLLIHSFIHSFITRIPTRRSCALQQTFYGSPQACPLLGFPPPFERKPCKVPFPDIILDP